MKEEGAQRADWNRQKKEESKKEEETTKTFPKTT